MTSFPTTYPIATKAHRCAECGRKIPNGACYARISGEVEGRAWSEPMCLRCDGAWARAKWRFGGWTEDDGPCIGELAEWMWEARHDRTVWGCDALPVTARWTPLDAVRVRRARIRTIRESSQVDQIKQTGRIP